MNTKDAYNTWSEQYDTNFNRTRDLEGLALKQVLGEVSFKTCLEIGCGTGKNTQWLLTKADKVVAVDFSLEMLSKAKAKINSENIHFMEADITQPWTFTNQQFDLIVFSLVLEHIEDLDFIFQNVSNLLAPGGHVYVGELHPFKQYSGTKARFETENGLQIVPCFTHHVSEFVESAKNFGLAITDVNEYFDDNDKQSIPRILTMLFNKKA